MFEEKHFWRKCDGKAVDIKSNDEASKITEKGSNHFFKYKQINILRYFYPIFSQDDDRYMHRNENRLRKYYVNIQTIFFI